MPEPKDPEDVPVAHAAARHSLKNLANPLASQNATSNVSQPPVYPGPEKRDARRFDGRPLFNFAGGEPAGSRFLDVTVEDRQLCYHRIRIPIVSWRGS